MAIGLEVGMDHPSDLVPKDSWSEAGDIVAGPTTRGSAKAGYSLWTYDGASWQLTKDQSAEGFKPANPPSVPGRFKGQVRAILAVPA